MANIVALSEFRKLAGRCFGPSAWFRISQDRIDLFADATLDHQFIHVDPERARTTPAGTTIAHGFLVLSLIPHLSAEIAPRPLHLSMAYNYGLDRLRFLQPVKVNSELRARIKVLNVTEKKPGQFRLASEVTVEIKGETKAALVAESLAMYFASEPDTA